MISENFEISLPNNYEVVENRTESFGFSGADFEVNVELKFAENGFAKLQEELQKIDSLKKNDNEYIKDIDGEIAVLTIDKGKRTLKFKFIHI